MEIIKSKTINDIEYSIVCKYCIYEHNTAKDGEGVAHADPEIASFINKEDAINYLDSLV